MAREDGLGHHLSGMPEEWVRRLVQSDDETDSLADRLRVFHTPTITPSESAVIPAFGGPTPVVFGTTMGLQYDTTTDVSHRIMKIQTNYVGPASFHVHWTKSGNVNEAGNTVRWRLSYTVFDGESDEIALVTPSVIEWDDTYEDSGTTTRIVYRTEDIEVTDLVPRYYIGATLEYVPAATTLTSDPVVISADLLWTGFLNNGA